MHPCRRLNEYLMTQPPCCTLILDLRAYSTLSSSSLTSWFRRGIVSNALTLEEWENNGKEDTEDVGVPGRIVFVLGDKNSRISSVPATAIVVRTNATKFRIAEEERDEMIGGKTVDVPMFLVRESPTSFWVATGKCEAPAPWMFGNKASGAFELDVERDVPVGYREDLKKTALALTTALVQETEWDVSGSIFSVGFGANLVANTICGYWPDEDDEDPVAPGIPKHKATLLIIDRTLDLWTPLSNHLFEDLQDDDESASIERLHDQLVEMNEANDILSQLCLAVDNGLMEPSRALGLALRASSLAGQPFVFEDFSLCEDFGLRLGCTGESIQRFLRESSYARYDCFSHNPESGKFTGGPMVSGESFVATTLRRAIRDNNSVLPAYVTRASKLDVTNVAFSLLGSVFGGSSSTTLPAMHKRIIVFFLGGFSYKDQVSIHKSIPASSYEELFVSGTHVFDREDFEMNALRVVKAASSYAAASQRTSTTYTPPRNNRDIAKLFSF